MTRRCSDRLGRGKDVSSAGSDSTALTPEPAPASETAKSAEDVTKITEMKIAFL